MRYAIISDIHSNLEAFKAVIQSCKTQGVQALLCIGDIVGYGANPKECIEIVKQLNTICVAGNHDWAVAGRIDATYFHSFGKEAIAWTRNNIMMEDFTFLSGLDLVYKNKDLILTHGTLDDPLKFSYMTDVNHAADTFPVMERKICFVGHTHVPKVFIQKNENIYTLNVLDVELYEECKYIINVGSVGQPRDGIPLASYCIYDTDSGSIQINRVQYDIKTAQKKIMEAGLPKILYERLESGY